MEGDKDIDVEGAGEEEGENEEPSMTPEEKNIYPGM
jgi:hypothetical protein